MRLNLGLVLLIALPTFAAPPKPLVPNAVEDQYRPLPLDSQKLSGLLAQRMRANSEGFLEQQTKDLTAYSQEQAGSFLEAGSAAYDYTLDDRLKRIIDHLAGQITANVREHGKVQECGTEDSDCRYTLLGLIAHYRVTGNLQSLSAARQVADLFTNSNRGRSTALMEPMVYLYRYTSETRYLEFAKSTVITIIDPLTRAEAIRSEMLLAYLGGMQLYRATGNQGYLNQAVQFWQKEAATNLSITGSLGTSDSADKPYSDCLTVEWLQLTLELLRVTGDAKYADQLEKTVYNQLLAAQDPHTGNLYSAVPTSGKKTWSAVPDLCALQEARGIALIPALVWGRYDNGIAMNFYTAGRATAVLRHRRGTIQLYSESTFPETGQVTLHVEPDHNILFPLRLRVPQWAGQFTADIDGSHLVGTPGTYLTISREWKRGDTVNIAMNLPVHSVTRKAGALSEIAVQRGPQVLVLGTRLNPELGDLSEAGLAVSKADLTLGRSTAKLPSNWVLEQAYSIAGLYGGKPRDLTLVPFADAIDYRLWLRKYEVKQDATTY